MKQQMQWFLILSHYNFLILYLLKKLNERVNTLSRWKQNMLKDVFDEKVQYCMMQMIQLKMLSKFIQTALMTVIDVLKTSVI